MIFLGQCGKKQKSFSLKDVAVFLQQLKQATHQQLLQKLLPQILF